MMTDVPDEILVEFFRQAVETLGQLDPRQMESAASPGPALPSLAAIRRRLLEEQSACLQAVVERHSKNGDETLTVEDVQAALRRCSSSSSFTISSQLVAEMERMNEAARLAFARLVLYSEYLWLDEGNKDRDLKSSGELQDDDVRTFCGLCQASIKLPAVEAHLRTGDPIFTDLPSSSGDSETILPQKRLEYIQRLFLKALGYEPNFATQEIKQKFYHENNQYCAPADHEDGNNNLQTTFRATVKAMESALVEATAGSTHDTFFSGQSASDAGDGVTKVVAVEYSEKLIDKETGEELLTLTEDASPHAETMAGDEGERGLSSQSASTAAAAGQTAEVEQASAQEQQFRLAQQASALQQEILGELLSLRDEEREAKLTLAQEATDSVLQKAMERPPGPERVAVLTSIDPATQRLMAMHKLWVGMLAANGGKPPQLRNSTRPPANEY